MINYPTEVKKEPMRSKAGPIVRLDRFGKKYPLKLGPRQGSHDFWALRDVSFEVFGGQIFGVVGRNGAGKTTLLNAMAGVLSPTEGEVVATGKVLGLFNLGVGFQDELTGKENIFLNASILGASKQEVTDKMDAMIDFSELGEFIDMPLGSYSQGMRLRLAFSIVVNLDFDILVIDEVLAVGDALFQSKCFERLMDFRRAGKTLIITTQSMELIERLCDQVILLDHGKLLFVGAPSEVISKYRILMNTERFYVGPGKGAGVIFENTKKWADDIGEWDRKLGSREVVIDSVTVRNRWGLRCRYVRSGEPCSVRVCFTVRNRIREPHFGIAIFRTDGVYCYGPNTAFDRQVIREMKPGKGRFEVRYERLLLAPGDYRMTVAIWDKNGILPFDYHNGCYDLKVTGGRGPGKALLNVPFKTSGMGPGSDVPEAVAEAERLMKSPGMDSEAEASGILLLQLTDGQGVPKNRFRTREAVCLKVETGKMGAEGKECLWAGIFREDGVFCQDFFSAIFRDGYCRIFFSELPLLPGGYKVAAGIWDRGLRRFSAFLRTPVSFQMFFDKEDHGTVHLNHVWKWKLP